MKTRKKVVAAICAILFTTQISFAQSRPVYDLKTQNKITKLEQKERGDIEKARREIDKTREKAILKSESERSKADAAKARAEMLRFDLDSSTESIQNKAHEDILAITSVPYQSVDQVKEMKDREKKTATLNKEAIKSIEKIKKNLENAEKDAEKTEKNALKAQQDISESVRKAETKADQQALKIKSKTRDQIAKLQPALY